MPFNPIRIIMPDPLKDEQRLVPARVQTNFDLMKRELDRLEALIPLGDDDGGIVPPTPIISDEKYFYGYTASGGAGVDADGEDIPIMTEVIEDSQFTHAAGSAEVTINEDATYEIIAEAGFNFHEDDIIELAIYHDDGSGYVLVDGAVANCGV